MNHIKYIIGVIAALVIALSLTCMTSCGGDSVNTVADPNFESDGMPLDSIELFSPAPPKEVKLFVETSGSMNGFFRPNLATKFKTTVWSVFTGLSGITDGKVYPLSNSGALSDSCELSSFQTELNQGRFVSHSETQVPDMLRTIISSINPTDDQAAVLVSDMKYSPVGQKSMSALLEQYQIDIRNIIGNSNISVGFVCAVSQYLNPQGLIQEEKSPYFFIILGNAQNTTYLRNMIATWVENEGCYVESGDICVDYKTPEYTLRESSNLIKHPDYESVFTDVDPEYSDTCSFILRVDLKSFPWKATESKESLDSCLSIKTKYGSSVTFDIADIKDDHHKNREFQREAYVDYLVKVYNMASDSEVLEWVFSIEPFEKISSSDFNYILSGENEQELDKAFSFDKFIMGCHNGNINRFSREPKRILISQTSL